MMPIFPDDGEGFTPVTLTAEEPVAEFKVDRAVSALMFLEPVRDRFLSFRSCFAC